MANLMNSQNNMSSLYSKYQGFLAPAAKILVGDSGKELTKDLNAQVDSLNITLSVSTASSVSFSIINAYDYKTHTFQSGIMNQLCLGNLLKVKLGYGSNLELVFVGFIYSVRAEFHEMAVLTVTALDVRRVMGDAVRKGVVWKYTSYSNVFKQVMKPYKKLYSKLVVDNTKDNEIVSIMQNESDLDFVNRLALGGNREFFVCNDMIYFRRKSKRAAALTFAWGENLISFSKESIYADQKVQVLGLLKDGKDTVTATESVKTDSKVKSIVSGGMVESISSPESDTKDKAAQKAARKAEKLRQKKQSGQGSCVGIPQLVPGRPIKVTGLASQINGEYMVKEVTHSFGSDGFQTSFNIGGFC